MKKALVLIALLFADQAAQAQTAHSRGVDIGGGHNEAGSIGGAAGGASIGTDGDIGTDGNVTAEGVLTMGSGATVVTNADGTVKGAAIESAIAGTGLTYSAGVINRDTIDLTADVTGDLPVTEGGTGASDAATARTNLGVDAAGTDNSTNVTLTGTPDYITISGQEITRGTVDISDDTNLAAGDGLTLTGDSLAVNWTVARTDAAETFDDNLTVSGEFSADINLNWNAWAGPENGIWVSTADVPTEQLTTYASNRRVVRTITFETAVIDRAYGVILLPEDYDGRAMVASVYYTQSDTDTDAFQMQLGHGSNDDGDDLTSSGTFSSSTQNITPDGVTSRLQKYDFTFTPANGADAAGQIFYFSLLRIGTTESPGNSGNFILNGIKFHY